ncbi:MAG TPA: DinB family protein [Armatimonadota bacterium]|nr:DinB family protein [Armatimonadota bacterium]
MAEAPVIDDLIALTEKYYLRIRQLLAELPDARLGASLGGDSLTVAETIRHVAQCDLWYANGIDGGTRELPDVGDDRASLEQLLQHSEAEMLDFLRSTDSAALAVNREVPTWWAEGADRSGQLVLMHSLAHKYYHCGQLQAILHTLG